MMKVSIRKMPPDFRSALSFAFWPAALALGYFSLAQISVHLTNGANGTATIWPSSGLLLAGLILNSRNKWWLILLFCGIASTLANFLTGTSLFDAAAFTVANLIEASFAVFLLGAAGTSGSNFSDPRKVGKFAIASVLAGILSAMSAMLFTGEWTAAFFLSWSATVILGMLIITPLITTIAQTINGSREHALTTDPLSAALVIGLVAAITAAVFAQDAYPLMFLPLAAVVLATYQLGPIGAATSVFCIALIGSLFTFNGIGPVHLMRDSEYGGVLFFQFYVLVNLASALPLAALLGQRDRNFASLEVSNRFLEMAERAAHVGHWRLDLADNQLFLSDETYRIHGRDADWDITLSSAIESYCAEDRQNVRRAIEQAAITGAPFEFEACIRRPDGEMRHVLSRGETQKGSNGKVIALFGMIMDVTDRVKAMSEIEETRKQALEDARKFETLAETDQLTGIANRRKALAVLRDEIARAQAFGSDLTVALLDVDHFKMVNDTCGHGVGDEVLARLTRTCSAALREGDLIGRMGGEEFILIFPGTSIKAAEAIADRLRQTVADLDWPEDALGSITVSIGMAAFFNGAGEGGLIKAADRALYEAKRGGRNLIRAAA